MDMLISQRSVFDMHKVKKLVSLSYAYALYVRLKHVLVLKKFTITFCGH